jgi:hypothetical protein
LITELEAIVSSNKEGLVQNWTISAEQAKKLLLFYNKLDERRKQVFLKSNVFGLLSWITKLEIALWDKVNAYR